MNSLYTFAFEQFPSHFSDTVKRRNTFANFLNSIFSTDISVNYNFVKVIGDGNCFFHAILRYLAFLTWLDLPNKDTNQLDEEEELNYTIILSNLRTGATDFIRNFLGQNDYVLDPNVPEYQLICKYIADNMNLRIVVIEYDAFSSGELNKVYLFEPVDGEFSDSVILINLGNHFTLVFPVSTDPLFDTKTIRNIATNNLISNAHNVNKLF